MHKKRRKNSPAPTPTSRRPALLPPHFNHNNLVEATSEVPYQVRSGILAYVAKGSIVEVHPDGRADVRDGGVAIVRAGGHATLHPGAIGYASHRTSTLVPLDGSTAYYLPNARAAIRAPGGRAKVIEVSEIPTWQTLQTAQSEG
jgi:hypothetical protein